DGLKPRPTRPSASGKSATSLAPTPASPSIAKTEPPPAVKQRPDGFWEVSFANLASFPYETPPADKPPSPGAVRKIPEDIRSLDGKRVRLAGYMLPLKLEGGLA